MITTTTDNPNKTLHQIIVFTIVKLVLLFVMFGLIFWQGKNFLQNKAQNLSEKKSMIAILQTRESQGQKLQNDWAQVEADFSMIEGALVSKDDLTNYIGQLEDLAAKTGVEQTLKFEEKETADKGSASLGFELSVKGNLSTLNSYLGGFQSLPFIIKIEKIEFTSSQSLSKEGQAKIVAKIYLQKSETVSTTSSSTTTVSKEELK